MKIKLQIGDRVTVRYIDGEMLAHRDVMVRDVAQKGFFAAEIGADEDDPGTYIPYSKLGTTVFLDGKLMEERMVDVEELP
jgi:hypothetical protein